MKRKAIINFIKFILFVAIFYALLAFNVFHLWEKLVPSSKDYLETSISEDREIEETYFTETAEQTTGHFAAENNFEAMKDRLCEKIAICEKIHFKGKYTVYDEYIYTKAIATLIDFIDRNGTQSTPIKDIISSIDINKDMGKRRGYATRDAIIFNLWSVSSKKEFAELLTHEMGHVTDLWYLQGTSIKKDRSYTEFGKVVFAINDLSLDFYKISRDKETIRKAEAKKKDFCSWYGMSDPFEDFSECFNMYVNHNALFREIAKNNIALKKKYNFIAGIVNGKYIASKTSELNLIKENTARRPRDTTKISN